MTASKLTSAELSFILVARAMKRTEEEIERLEYALARMRLKQAARSREIARQCARNKTEAA